MQQGRQQRREHREAVAAHEPAPRRHVLLRIEAEPSPRNRENFPYSRRGQRVTRSVLAGSKPPVVASAQSTRQAPRVASSQ